MERHESRKEWREMFQLALPVVVAEVGWNIMGAVDTMMVGRLSAEAIGAVSLGSAVFFAVTIFGMGLLLGLDTMISQAFGAGDFESCHRSLFHGVYAAFVLAVPLTMILLWGTPLLGRYELNEDVIELTLPYLRPVTYGLLPLLLYASLRRYLQATNHLYSIMFVLASANLVNVLANWVLIFGNLGLPAMGIEGAGWATCVSRVYLAVGLAGFLLYYNWREQGGLFRSSFAPELSRFERLSRLGLPAAVHTTLEFGLFAVATFLAAKLDAASLAAHQIVLTAAAVTFMVPLGVSSAAAVRVGHAIGRGEPRRAARAGWMAIGYGVSFMAMSMLVFLTVPEILLAGFTDDPRVVDVGVGLFYVAGAFQLFDGLQVVAAGALRGAGETRLPMLVGLFGYWGLGLPIGYALCFRFDWGIRGLWIGLLAGLFSVSLALADVWRRKARALHRT